VYPFERVAAELRADIESGRLGAGDVVPSEPELARRFAVSRMTVRNAIKALENEGLILSRQGARTVVTDSGREPVSLESDLAEIKAMLAEILRRLPD
jgi:DNA-binding GntR family transcriptional regulator